MCSQSSLIFISAYSSFFFQIPSVLFGWYILDFRRVSHFGEYSTFESIMVALFSKPEIGICTADMLVGWYEGVSEWKVLCM